MGSNLGRSGGNNCKASEELHDLVGLQRILKIYLWWALCFYSDVLTLDVNARYSHASPQLNSHHIPVSAARKCRYEVYAL